MSIQELTQHPELMNRETLYELRGITASYPYYQPARLLLLKNLYLLHDPSFDEELRRSAIYFTDRRVLFNMIESAHYRLKHPYQQERNTISNKRKHSSPSSAQGSRTVSLIDTYLNSIPAEESDSPQDKGYRKPTATDATIDYVAYLQSTDFADLNETDDTKTDQNVSSSQLNGSDLIDAFIKNDGGKFTLQEEPETHPELQGSDNGLEDSDNDFMTETLANIYIKQGRYEKALEIVNKINNTSNKKNSYYEDQQRFLKKLIKNQSK